MITAEQIKKLADLHGPTFRKLRKIEDELCQRFYGMDDSILALILSAAAAEPMLFIGSPGTAKSQLIRTFCHCLGLIDLGQENGNGSRNEAYFEYLLTKFTEPSELFGYFEILEIGGRKKLEREAKNMMQHASVVYLDEVFNASSAILNSILTFLNERMFHDRGEAVPVEMKFLLGATNDVPKTPELKAVYDRFLIRSVARNVDAEAEKVADLLQRGWKATFDDPPGEKVVFPELLEKLDSLQQSLPTQLIPPQFQPGAPGFLERLTALVQDARLHGFSEVSNRRLVKMLKIMILHRAYQLANSKDDPAISHELCKDDLKLFPLYFLDHYEDEMTIQRLLGKAEEPF